MDSRFEIENENARFIVTAVDGFFSAPVGPKPRTRTPHEGPLKAHFLPVLALRTGGGAHTASEGQT